MPYLGLLLWFFAAGQDGTFAAKPTFEQVSRAAAEARGQNRIEEAIGLYRQALQMRESWPEGWWFLGELLYDQDKYGEARDALRRLISLDPKTGPGFALLGLCEYETHEFERALTDINEARRLGLGDDPQVRRVVLYHAVLLFTRFGLYESALEVLEKVLKLGAFGNPVIQAAGLAGLRRPMAPEDLPAADKDLVELAGKAVCAMTQQRTTDAQKYFTELVGAYPNAANVHYLYGTFLLPTDSRAGIAEFQKELELNPRHAEALLHLALESTQLGDSAKALSYAQRAVQAAPQYFAAHMILGRFLAESGETEKGIQELELARKQAPDSPQVHFALASAYTLAGKDQDSARERVEFLRLKRLADATLGTVTASPQ